MKNFWRKLDDQPWEDIAQRQFSATSIIQKYKNIIEINFIIKAWISSNNNAQTQYYAIPIIHTNMYKILLK